MSYRETQAKRHELQATTNIGYGRKHLRLRDIITFASMRLLFYKLLDYFYFFITIHLVITNFEVTTVDE